MSKLCFARSSLEMHTRSKGLVTPSYTTPNFKFTTSELEELRLACFFDEHNLENPHTEKTEFHRFTPVMKKVSELLNEQGFQVIDLDEKLFEESYPCIMCPDPTDPTKLKKKYLNFEYHLYETLTIEQVTRKINQEEHPDGYFDSYLAEQSRLTDPAANAIFSAHRDNISNIPVCTMLYYPCCTYPKGGQLQIFDDFNLTEPTIQGRKRRRWITFDPRETQCICLNGNVLHRSLPCYGYGRREVIVFQVPVKNFREKMIEQSRSSTKRKLDSY